jgi:hypothetical protein
MQSLLWLKREMWLRGTPIGPGQNVAAFSGDLPNGQPVDVAFPSASARFWKQLGLQPAPGNQEPLKGDAEQRLKQAFDDAGVPPDAITEVASDLEPCSLPTPNCKAMLQTLTGLKRVFYTDPYPGYSKSFSPAVNAANKAIRQQSVDSLRSQNTRLYDTYDKIEQTLSPGCGGGDGTANQNGLEGGALRARRVPSRSALAATGTACGPSEGESPEDGALPEALADPAEALDPGGIDFTSLQLRYLSLSGPHQGDLQYSMDSDGAPVTTNSGTGLQTAQEDSAAFFTWLTLPPSTFWVNLMPNYPPQIIDPRFELTDAGRVLLQSDLLLKQAALAAVNPATSTGAQFWQRLLALPPSSNKAGGPCVWGHEWIVPGVATVHATRTQLYIRNAPLKVRLAPVTHLPGKLLAPICQQDPRQIGYEAAYRQLIQPELTNEVNTAPQFEPLRRIYMSRVAAQWVRQEAGSNTVMGQLVDSGLHRSWIVRPSWSPFAIWQQFLHTWDTPVYYTFPVPDGGTTVNESLPVYGGVDFSHKIREKDASNRQFKAHWRGLAAAAKRSIKQPSKGGGTTLVGGGIKLGATTHRNKHLKVPEVVRIPRRFVPPSSSAPQTAADACARSGARSCPPDPWESRFGPARAQ